MKHLSLILIILLSVGFTNCANPKHNEKEQTKSEHMTFKGVPIDGSVKQFVSKMESAGFSHIDTQNDTYVLEGDFAGFKGCLIGVSTLKNSDIVNTISVIFPDDEEWSYLEENYKYLKNMLTEKYGQPTECVEEFQHGTSGYNISKLYSLKLDQCTYVTVFETPNGDIELSMEHDGLHSCFVKLQYWDRINTDKVKATVMNDI